MEKKQKLSTFPAAGEDILNNEFFSYNNNQTIQYIKMRSKSSLLFNSYYF